MMSANESLWWLFMNDYNVRYPDIIAHNPGDGKKHHPTHTHAPKPHVYATHGNRTFALSLLLGSIGSVVIFFAALPLLFRPNFSETLFDHHVDWSSNLKTRKNVLTY
jgi:hypothetical protein